MHIDFILHEIQILGHICTFIPFKIPNKKKKKLQKYQTFENQL